MNFLPPVFLFLFSFVFLGVWWLERSRPYIALFSCAYFLVSLGVLLQVLQAPSDAGANDIISTALYIAGILCFSQATMLRSGRSLPIWFHALFSALIIFSTVYFYYFERNLFYRIYMINLGVGLVLLATAYRGRFWLRGKLGDKVLFWLVFLLGVHFFPRTFLTANRMIADTYAEFMLSPFWQVLQFTIAVAGVAMGLGLLAVIIIDIIAELRKERDTDPLTGLANRRLFMQHVERIIGKGREQKKSVAFAMIDVDHFKSYNDLYGHLAGDDALKQVARVLNSSLRRPEDIAARIGGEEFGLFFYDCSVQQAKPALDLIRKRIADLNIQHNGSPVSTCLTISVGVAERMDDEVFEQLFRRADQSLYNSKATGRDQVTMA